MRPLGFRSSMEEATQDQEVAIIDPRVLGLAFIWAHGSIPLISMDVNPGDVCGCDIDSILL